jgi:hypothetical protein
VLEEEGGDLGVGESERAQGRRERQWRRRRGSSGLGTYEFGENFVLGLLRCVGFCFHGSVSVLLRWRGGRCFEIRDRSMDGMEEKRCFFISLPRCGFTGIALIKWISLK